MELERDADSTSIRPMFQRVRPTLATKMKKNIFGIHNNDPDEIWKFIISPNGTASELLEHAVKGGTPDAAAGEFIKNKKNKCWMILRWWRIGGTRNDMFSKIRTRKELDEGHMEASIRLGDQILILSPTFVEKTVLKTRLLVPFETKTRFFNSAQLPLIERDTITI